MADMPFTSEEALRSFIQRYYQENGVSSAVACCSGDESQERAPGQCTCYAPEQLKSLPAELLAGACCCGNPLKYAQLKPGEIVLDLGCGTGLDVLLAARQVQPGGVAYGVDMNEVALGRAEQYRRQLGLENARFLHGIIEAVPLPSESIDVIISNCVINLAPDKERVLREAYRLLKPGGRLVLADTVLEGEPPARLQREPRAWATCLTGAISAAAYRELLAAVGFQEVVVELASRDWGWPPFVNQEERHRLEGRWLSASIRAHKPSA
ncbi:MAG: methyltransferase domain-containing protein [Thermogemmatispora sp.]|uniref:methyltransferase domain-containing protein n=1 Tax=Thermogemmatispora sp. TaxID=1968838 RepID=UPI00262AF651|nr:methyltransferase domain-containing protein [Thermogemmatispora sp.]MBX5456178.1 methyltransferase domain-containing protein [Thermogemmatispora sp.]